MRKLGVRECAKCEKEFQRVKAPNVKRPTAKLCPDCRFKNRGKW